jgi:protein-disulfide isomerase
MRLPAVAVCLAALAAAPLAAQDGALSPAQAEAVDARVRDYILRNPEIILEALQALEARRDEDRARDDAALIAANAEALFDDGYSHVFGAEDGDVTIVEFADYRCGYCKAAHPQIAELLATDPGLRVIHKELPVLGPDSVMAARVAMAALAIDPARYEQLNDALMRFRGTLDEATVFRLAAEAGLSEAALRTAMEDPAIADGIRSTYALARALGVEGTPSFVIGERIVRGYVQIEQMRALIEQARRARG